jgi:hypothetical protein
MAFEVYIVQGKGIPLQAHGVPGDRGSKISRQSADEGGKFVSLTHRPPLLPRSQPQGHN